MSEENVALAEVDGLLVIWLGLGMIMTFAVIVGENGFNCPVPHGLIGMVLFGLSCLVIYGLQTNRRNKE